MPKAARARPLEQKRIEEPTPFAGIDLEYSPSAARVLDYGRVFHSYAQSGLIHRGALERLRCDLQNELERHGRPLHGLVPSIEAARAALNPVCAMPPRVGPALAR